MEKGLLDWMDTPYTEEINKKMNHQVYIVFTTIMMVCSLIALTIDIILFKEKEISKMQLIKHIALAIGTVFFFILMIVTY